MYGRKRSDFQVHVIEVDDKRHVVRVAYLVLLIFWADASPEVRFKTAIIIVIIAFWV